ncbi:MAG: hypothetical protein Q8P67_11125, partial [archaeon]|nr:hypothetical protein [archaeon]
MAWKGAGWEERKRWMATGGGGGGPMRSGGGEVFVSQYWTGANAEEMEAYFHKHHMVFRTSGEEYVLRDCPHCHETHGKPDNLWKLYFSRSSGVFFCHRCAAKGSWFDFKAKRTSSSPRSSGIAVESLSQHI